MITSRGPSSCGPTDDRHARLDDAGFLRGDIGDGHAQKFLMIETDRRDDTHTRPRNHIGCVILTTQPDFQDERVTRVSREGKQRRRGRDLEKGDRRTDIHPLAFVEHCRQLILFDQFSGEPDAFVKAHEMRRDIRMYAQALRLEHRARKRANGAFAVRPGDVDNRRKLAFGMAQLSQESLNSVQNEIDSLGVKRKKPFENGVAFRSDAHDPLARPLARPTAAPLPDVGAGACLVALPLMIAGAGRDFGRGCFVRMWTSREIVARIS